MKKSLLKTLAIALILLAMPMKHFGQQPRYAQNASTIDFDITGIDLFEERIIFLYNLINDSRFDVVNSEQDGVFIISADPAYEDLDLATTFSSFQEQNARAISKMDKETLAETALAYKSLLPKEFVLSLMMDVYAKSRQNNHCNTADPFCTDNGLYQFPAGVNAGSGESGPNYNCLSTTPNPAWYYMRIGNPGSITIHMYSTPSVDIDFCCWGPFDDPITPCPNGLTGPKVVSCSYSTAATENCQIPSSAQTGQYYILIITNYSNANCNITFSKTSGNGTTDCGIMPPLVDNDGPYCVGDDIHLTANGQSGASYSWTGPHGYTSSQQNPVISNCSMSHTGSYVCTISLNGQTNNASTEVQVYAKPTANFNATSVCVGSPTQFTNTSTSNPSGQAMTYEWNFDGEGTSTQQNPTFQFATAGNHSVTLTASCGNGTCTSTRTQTVTVYATPVANAGPDQTVIYDATATLSGSGGSGSFNYHWEPANTVTNPNSQTTQTVSLQQSTTFTLTVTHPQGGCSSTDEVSILVEGSNMTATASATPNAICLGESAQLRATAVGGTQNYTYLWTPSIGLSAPNIANPIATPTSTTTYTCTVSDGMSTQTVSTTITVNNPEHVEEDHYICPGESYNFYGTSYSEEGDYVYQTTTAQGCEKTITLHLHHYPTYPNAHTTEEYICPGTSCHFHGHYYNTAGLYSETLETVHGCDSVVWLNLTVYPANDTIVETPSICSTQTLLWHGHEYSQDGDIAYFDTVDYHGCLLVHKLQLTVGDYQTPQNYDPNKYICVPYDEERYYHWDIANRDYYDDAMDTIIIAGPPGECDYKYTLNLKFHNEFYHVERDTVCDAKYWPITGQTYTATNHYIEKVFQQEFGPNNSCDSTYVLDLTVFYSDVETVIDTTYCGDYYWNFGWDHEQDTTVTEEGYHVFSRRIDTKMGHILGIHCDSIVTLKLTLEKSPEFERIEGKSWVVGGSEFQYTTESYWINVPGSHKTTWELTYKDGTPFNKWDTLTYDNGDRLLVYIYTYELDTIYVHATTTAAVNQQSGSIICEGATFSQEKMIICTPYGTQEVTSKSSVDIYPNPNDGNMTLSFNNMSGEIIVKVFNMQGIMIDQFLVNGGYESNTFPYNSNRLSSGIYVFSFASKEGTLTKKVVITK